MRLYADGINYSLELHQSNKRLPYLLMLHGFMGSGRTFSHIIDPLSKFCNPITLDLAGHGNTKSPADPERFTANRQVSQIKSILDRLSFYDMYLYGYSMGGRLALQMLVNHPVYFKGALIESAHCGIRDANKRAKRRTIDKERAEQIRENYQKFLQNWIKMPLFQVQGKKSSFQYLDIMKSQNPELMCTSLQSFGAGSMPEICGELKKLRKSITLIAGEYDKKYVELLSSIAETNPNFSFNEVPEAGHRVHADQPIALIRIMKSIISKP